MVMLPKADDLPRLQSAGGANYQITTDDAELLVRMGVFEGGDPAFTLWAIAQRWVMFRDQYARQAAQNDRAKTEYPLSLKGLVEAFSQALNPAWRRDGKFCKSGGEYHGKAECAPAALERRERAAKSPLEDVYQKDPEAFERSLSWLRAEVPNPVPRAVNWSAEAIAGRYLSRHTDAAEIARNPANTCPACNVFITESAARRWGSNYVWLELDGRRMGAQQSVANVVRGVWDGLTAWWRPGRGPARLF